MDDHRPDPVRELLTHVSGDPLRAVAELSAMRTAVDEALDQAMARAALEGHSVRAIAERAGVAPNAVTPRLARTQALAPYAEEHRVSARGIERARYDREQGRPAPEAPTPEPMRFRRRTPRP